MEEKKHQFILVIDPESDYLDKLKKDDNPNYPLLVFSAKLRDAQRKLSNRDLSLRGIFINPSIGNPCWVSLVKNSHDYHSGVPIFLFSELADVLDNEKIKRLGIQAKLQKPLLYNDIIDCVESKFSGKDLEEKFSHKESELDSEQINMVDASFVAVSGERLISNMPSSFDIYLKLNSDHYVKIIRTGDFFSSTENAKYKKKGVEEYYILSSDVNEYMDYCNDLISKTIQDTQLSLDLKSAELASYGDEIMYFLRHQNISSDSLVYAENFMDCANQLISELPESDNKSVLSKFIYDAVAVEHAVATSIIAGLMVNFIGVEAKPLFSAIGLACFFHDIALINQSEAVQEEIVENMNAEEKEIYFNHPQDGAKILSEIRGLSPAVVQAVEQHHMCIPTEGFTPTSKHVKINRVAEVVSICDQFVLLINQSNFGDSGNPAEIMRKEYLKYYSEPIANAFEKSILKFVAPRNKKS